MNIIQKIVNAIENNLRLLFLLILSYVILKKYEKNKNQSIEDKYVYISNSKSRINNSKKKLINKITNIFSENIGVLHKCIINAIVIIFLVYICQCNNKIFYYPLFVSILVVLYFSYNYLNYYYFMITSKILKIIA